MSSSTTSWVAAARWIALATLLLSGANYLFSLSMAQLLPPAEFVDYVGVQSLLLVVGTGVMATVPWVMAREVAAPDGLARDAVLAFGLLASTAQGLVAALAVGTFAWFAGGAGLALASAVAAFCLSLVAAPVGLLQGGQRFRRLALLRLVEGSVRIGAGLLLVLVLDRSAALAVAGMPLGSLVLVVVGLGASATALTLRSVSLRDVRRLSRDGAALGSVQLLVVLLATLDSVAAAFLLPSDLGYAYQAASLLGRAPFFVAMALAVALYPTLVRTDDAGIGTEIRRATGGYLRVAAVAVVGLAALPTPVARLLVGEDSARLTAVLPLTVAIGTLSGVVVLVAVALQASDRCRPTSVALAALCLLSAVALLTAAGRGVVAYGSAGLVSLGTAAAVALVLGRRWRVHAVPPGVVVHLGLAVALAVAVRSTGSDVGWWVVAVAASGATALVLGRTPAHVVLGATGRDPAQVVAEQLAGIGAGRAGPGRRPRVLVVGNVGNGNTGDEALLAVTLHHLGPGVDVQVVSRDPDLVGALHGVVGVAMGPRPFLRALWRADAVVVVGGGMFGPGLPPLVALLPAVVRSAAALGRDTAYVGIGVYAGMPRGVLTLLRLSAATSRGATVRDPASAALLGRRVAAVDVGDLSHQLPPAPPDDVRAVLEASGLDDGRPLLLVAPKSADTPERTEQLLADLGALVGFWVAHGGTAAGVAFAAASDHGMPSTSTDTALVGAVGQRAGHPLRIVGPHLPPGLLKGVLGAADAVVGLRFHAIVFAHDQGVPATGRAWEPKTSAYLADHGVPAVESGDGLLAWADAAFENALAGRLAGGRR